MIVIRSTSSDVIIRSRTTRSYVSLHSWMTWRFVTFRRRTFRSGISGTRSRCDRSGTRSRCDSSGTRSRYDISVTLRRIRFIVRGRFEVPGGGSHCSYTDNVQRVNDLAVSNGPLSLLKEVKIKNAKGVSLFGHQ